MYSSSGNSDSDDSNTGGSANGSTNSDNGSGSGDVAGAGRLTATPRPQPVNTDAQPPAEPLATAQEPSAVQGRQEHLPVLAGTAKKIGGRRGHGVLAKRLKMVIGLTEHLAIGMVVPLKANLSGAYSKARLEMDIAQGWLRWASPAPLTCSHPRGGGRGGGRGRGVRCPSVREPD